jgi:ABC-type lipoprotein export system ATPase subunit
MVRSVPLVRLEYVRRAFDDGAVLALDDVNLSIYPGDCVVILGKSGSGKSTLLHILSGCDNPTSGEVYWQDEPVCGQRTWRELRATEIGIIFQEFHLFSALTAIENVEMALMGKPMSSGERARCSAEVLERVGLGKCMRHLPNQLSGGERQRVAIARSIVNEPSLLLADEPTGNLDSLNANLIVDLLLEIQEARGTALIMVTHDESLAARCRRRVLLKDGRIIDDRLPEQTQGFGNRVADTVDAGAGI